ncbi:MAG: AAA family ATPase [Candidatus Bathyarchaeia archaeon]
MDRYSEIYELERELMRKERQIEYLQMELRKCYQTIEELKQGMKPVGTVVDVRDNRAYVKFSGQLYEVSIPPEYLGKITPNMDVILSPNRGTIIGFIENLRDGTAWSYKIEKEVRVYYDDVVGLEYELNELRKVVEWILNPLSRERRENLLLDKRLLEEGGSVLLYGPPGTGKTYMAKAIAGTCTLYGCKTSFIKVDGYEVVSKWLGESARNIKEIFRLARDVAPSILFIDEVDAIGRSRVDVTTDAGRDVQGMLNQLLIELGEGFETNRNIAVIFATNFPSVIDPALLDRVKKILYVPPPKTRETVKRLFDFYTSKIVLDASLKDGKVLKEEVFEKIWSIIKRRRLVYEASIPRRNIKVRDEYCITPRDVKNIVLEAVDEAYSMGKKMVDEECLLSQVESFVKEELRSQSV